MRGLIEKDLRLVLIRKQTILVFFVMTLFMSISSSGFFVVNYFTMIATIIAIGTISYDEFDNGFAFLMTLPFDRKTYVREKYLFSFVLSIVAWFVGTFLYYIGNVFRHNTANVFNELPMLIAMIPTMYLAGAILIPIQLKYGAEKSRLVLLILFGLIAILLFGVQSILGLSNNLLAELVNTLDRLSPTIILLTLAAICALVVYACYLCSIKIMEKKEF